jgi:hypothetical protein
VSPDQDLGAAFARTPAEPGSTLVEVDMTAIGDISDHRLASRRGR